MYLRSQISWFSLLLAALLFLFILFIFATRLTGILDSNAAYEITLIVIGIGSLLVVLFSIFTRKKRPGTNIM